MCARAINEVEPMAEVEAKNELEWVEAVAGVEAKPEWKQWPGWRRGGESNTMSSCGGVTIAEGTI